jgi:hypothetical protein
MRTRVRARREARLRDAAVHVGEDHEHCSVLTHDDHVGQDHEHCSVLTHDVHVGQDHEHCSVLTQAFESFEIVSCWYLRVICCTCVMPSVTATHRCAASYMRVCVCVRACVCACPRARCRWWFLGALSHIYLSYNRCCFYYLLLRARARRCRCCRCRW